MIGKCRPDSLTAALAHELKALGVIRLYVGVENTLTDRLTPWRPFLVFAFGLLHGLGFAGVVGEIGLPVGQRAAGCRVLPALLSRCPAHEGSAGRRSDRTAAVRLGSHRSV